MTISSFVFAGGFRNVQPAPPPPVLYIAGDFSGASSVRASTRNRAAAIAADVDVSDDAMVKAWDPNCSTTVQTMALNGSDMYLGGAFTTVRSTARNRAACVDSDQTQAAPTLRAWNPNCGDAVRTMLLNGSDMYLGGNFTTVRGTARNYTAAVDSDSSQAAPTLRAWDPDCNSSVWAMLINGSDIYLGGYFTTVRSTARLRAACVDSDTSQAAPTLRAWDPNCGGAVLMMILDGADMYLGGDFTTVRGTGRNRAAAVDSDSSQAAPTLRAWNPDCSSQVNMMILNGSDMYLGGQFVTVRGTARNRAACVDSDVTQASPTLRAWDPNCGNRVYTMALNGSDMYLGGAFTTVGGTARNYVAAIDSSPTQAAPTLRAWDPDCNNSVRAMSLSP